MNSETIEDIQTSFNQIDIEDEPGSEKNNIYSCSMLDNYYKPQPTLRFIPKCYVDFEQYIKENCQSKIKVLNRETFHDNKHPVIIFFNHFRMKCAYHTKWLDTLYQLALKYGDRIEFIAADMIDMDIMYPGRNPIDFFCRLVRPEHESPYTYAIDKKKRVHEHFDAFKTVETLTELCENLLCENLFPSQPIPKKNSPSLVKICVHHNHDELILKSTKNIFLIINYDGYQNCNEPNYENVALALKDYNLDIVYMEAEKNYIPFEYHANCYPTILFIPFNDKNNFIYYEGQRDKKLIIEFLKSIMEKPEILQLKQQQLKFSVLKKNFEVPNDFQIDFNELSGIFQQFFESRFKLLDRKMLESLKRYLIVVFMDFSNNTCLAHHIQWINKIYLFAATSFSYTFFVADYKDIDIINTKWKSCDIKNSAQGKPKIYVIDHLKHTYEFGNFDSPADLFYFTNSVESRQLYYSQLYERKNQNEKVKVWTADYFNVFLKKCKSHIFITFYSSEDENAANISNLLNQIADEVADHNVEIAKFDIQFNYVDLEYCQESYPVHYFIPKNKKNNNKLYIDKDLNRRNIVDFIVSNL